MAAGLTPAGGQPDADEETQMKKRRRRDVDEETLTKRRRRRDPDEET